MAPEHGTRPELAEFGELRYRGQSVYLSPLEEAIVEQLLRSFGAVVAIDAAAEPRVVRLRISRLRHRVHALGLTIKNARGAGYVMRPIA